MQAPQCRESGFSQERHDGSGSSGNSEWFPAARRNTFFTGTPEIYFAKAIDNSRLVKVEDPGHNREMKQFGTALASVPAGVHLCLAAFPGD